MTFTTVSNMVVPSVFAPYLAQETATKNRLVQSGAVGRSAQLDALLAGGGRTFDVPSFAPLAETASNVSSDSGGAVTPLNVSTSKEVLVRLSRNQAFGSADLAGALAGADPLEFAMGRFSTYWERELQAVVIATLAGVFADNAANDSGDYTNDITDTFSAGVTDFSVSALIDAQGTMGDAAPGDFTIVMHSTVYNKARQKNLIDFIPDTQNAGRISVIEGIGRIVVDDSVPVTSQDYTTYLIAPGALVWGAGEPANPVEDFREPLQYNGGGRGSVITRVEWAVHPVGHAYDGTAADGGPSNAATSNNLANAGSWDRVYSDRGQIGLASLETTEAA